MIEYNAAKRPSDKDFAQKCMRYAARKMEELEQQRDRARSKIENQAERIKYLEGATNHATGTPLSKMREQRDRLAEALRELCETLLAEKPRDITDLLNKAGEALAAVKGGSDE
jgi:hypothetical protein